MSKYHSSKKIYHTKLYNGDIFASFEALLSNHYKKHSEMVLIQLSYP